MPGKPTIRMRRLGERLHQIREDRRLTLAEAGDLVGRSRSSLGKIEKGQVYVHARDVDYILTKYGITNDVQRKELLALARDGRKEGWWTRHQKTLPPSVLDYIALEADANAMRSFELTLIPGLLQTEDYARAVIGAAHTHLDVEREVGIRMRRQRALTRPEPLRLETIISEAALRLVIGGAEVMRDQLRHLLDAARLGNVRVQMLPFQAGAHFGLDGSFTILDLGAFSIVNLQTLVGGSFKESQGDVSSYTAAFDRLREMALSEADSCRLIERAARTM